MKRILSILFVSFLCDVAVMAQPQLPQASPRSTVTQTVGLTDISLDFGSPGVKGRTIFGGLLPYDSLWRAGANAATKVTFSRDVTVGGKAVAKGSYSLFIIPARTGDWTVVLNTDPTASMDEYNKTKDVLRIPAKTETIPLRERLVFLVTDFTDSTANLVMEWERTRMSVPIVLATTEQALDNIKTTLGGTWRSYNAAARYMMDRKDLDAALKYADQSLALSDEWYNNWTRAQVLAEKKMYKEALVNARKAKELGEKNPSGFFSRSLVDKALAEWPTK